MTFASDDDALELLKLYGYKEVRNGVIRGNWKILNADCREAVQYLCDEWDFVFEDENVPADELLFPELERHKVGKITRTEALKNKLGEIQREVRDGNLAVSRLIDEALAILEEDEV